MTEILETQADRRGHRFYPAPAEALPRLYETEHLSIGDKIVRAHYFVGGCDWWLTEYDPDSHIAFGYACLGDPAFAEWGNVSLLELEQVRVHNLFVVERDLLWAPTRVADLNLPGMTPAVRFCDVCQQPADTVTTYGAVDECDRCHAELASS